MQRHRGAGCEPRRGYGRHRHSSTAVWLIAATMAGALVFGLVNHFLIASPDHVSQVSDPWRTWFGATAVLLLISEGVGAGLAVWGATAVARRRS